MTRERHLRSASDVVARDGYEGAFHSNFSSKDDILLQVLEGNAGRDVRELTELLSDTTDPDAVIDIIVRWSECRAAEQKWGLLAIEFLRRARRDDTRRRNLSISQWEAVGALLLDRLFPDEQPKTGALGLGGIVLDLTYGGIASFLGVNTSGQMLRHVPVALHESA